MSEDVQECEDSNSMVLRDEDKAMSKAAATQLVITSFGGLELELLPFSLILTP